MLRLHGHVGPLAWTLPHRFNKGSPAVVKDYVVAPGLGVSRLACCSVGGGGGGNGWYRTGGGGNQNHSIGPVTPSIEANVAKNTRRCFMGGVKRSF